MLVPLYSLESRAFSRLKSDDLELFCLKIWQVVIYVDHVYQWCMMNYCRSVICGNSIWRLQLLIVFGVSWIRYSGIPPWTTGSKMVQYDYDTAPKRKVTDSTAVRKHRSTLLKWMRIWFKRAKRVRQFHWFFPIRLEDPQLCHHNMEIIGDVLEVSISQRTLQVEEKELSKLAGRVALDIKSSK